MARIAIRTALGLVLVFALAGVATAKNVCTDAARDAAKACNASCKTDYKDEVAICHGKDPACAQICRDGRDECKDPIDAILDSCLDLCKPPLEAAKATCKASVGCGGHANPCGFNPAYITCLNPYQSAAFECRNLCHDAFRLNTQAQADLLACETSFKACVKACPAPAPTPPAN